jgi:hypothetical protein
VKTDVNEDSENSRTPKSRVDTPERWPLPAAILSAVICYWGTWPLRNALLVVWVYGTAGYSRGIRVLAGKPVKFTTGESAPTAPDIITGIGAFILAVGIALLIIYISIRLYGRFIRNSRNA